MTYFSFRVAALVGTATGASAARLRGTENVFTFSPITGPRFGASSPTIASPPTLGKRPAGSPIRRTVSSLAGLSSLGIEDEAEPEGHHVHCAAGGGDCISPMGKVKLITPRRMPTSRSSPTPLITDVRGIMNFKDDRATKHGAASAGEESEDSVKVDEHASSELTREEKAALPGSEEWAKATNFKPSIKRTWKDLQPQQWPGLIPKQGTFEDFMWEERQQLDEERRRRDGYAPDDIVTMQKDAEEMHARFLTLNAQDAFLPPVEALDRFLKQRVVEVRKYFSDGSGGVQLVGEMRFSGFRTVHKGKAALGRKTIPTRGTPEHSIRAYLRLLPHSTETAAAKAFRERVENGFNKSVEEGNRACRLAGMDEDLTGNVSIAAFLGNVDHQALNFFADRSEEEHGQFIYRVIQKPLMALPGLEERTDLAHMWLEDQESSPIPHDRLLAGLSSSQHMSVAGVLGVLLSDDGTPAQKITIKRTRACGEQETYLLGATWNTSGRLVLQLERFVSDVDGTENWSSIWESSLDDLDCWGTPILAAIPRRILGSERVLELAANDPDRFHVTVEEDTTYDGDTSDNGSYDHSSENESGNGAESEGYYDAL